MKLIFLLLVACMACGCGTVRYGLKAEKGAKGNDYIQWDIVKVDFNEGWKNLFKNHIWR
jgi:uncharacterized protein YceK